MTNRLRQARNQHVKILDRRREMPPGQIPSRLRRHLALLERQMLQLNHDPNRQMVSLHTQAHYEVLLTIFRRVQSPVLSSRRQVDQEGLVVAIPTEMISTVDSTARTCDLVLVSSHLVIVVEAEHHRVQDLVATATTGLTIDLLTTIALLAMTHTWGRVAMAFHNPGRQWILATEQRPQAERPRAMRARIVWATCILPLRRLTIRRLGGLLQAARQTRSLRIRRISPR